MHCFVCSYYTYLLNSEQSHMGVNAPTMAHGCSEDSPIPVTSCLVKVGSNNVHNFMFTCSTIILSVLHLQVLRYSDEDLKKLVDLAKRRAYQREREKVIHYSNRVQGYHPSSSPKSGCVHSFSKDN